MIIGDRLRALREQKNLSQGEIEKRTDSFVATFPVLKTGTPSRRRDPGEIRSRSGSPGLPTLLRWRRTPQAREPSAPREILRHRVGQFREECSRAGQVSAAFWAAANENDRRLLVFMAQKMARGKSN